jgi:hypothetical protein
MEGIFNSGFLKAKLSKLRQQESPRLKAKLICQLLLEIITYLPALPSIYCPEPILD